MLQQAEHAVGPASALQRGLGGENEPPLFSSCLGDHHGIAGCGPAWLEGVQIDDAIERDRPACSRC